VIFGGGRGVRVFVCVLAVSVRRGADVRRWRRRAERPPWARGHGRPRGELSRGHSLVAHVPRSLRREGCGRVGHRRELPCFSV
jgi:hypothetical protein